MKPYALLLVPGLLVLSACASAPKPAAAPAPQVAQTTTITSAEIAGDTDPVCDLVLDRPQVDPTVDTTDWRAREEENAEKVMKALEPEIFACYKRRVAAYPQAHAFMTIDVVVAPDGHVQNVETTGGALLGDGALECITKTIQRASFEPPHNGGTMRVHLPLALRKVAPGETP